MRNKAFGVSVFLLGLGVILTPMHLMPVCEYEGRARMICSYTGWSEMITGAVILCVSFGVFLSKSAETFRWLMFTTVALGAAVAATPGIIGFCPSPFMPCNFGAVPVLRLLGVVVSAAALAGFALSFRKAGPVF